MQKKQIISGRVLYVSDKEVYLARGAKIYLSRDGGQNWQLWVTLSVSFWTRVSMRISFLARLLRLGVHHLAFSGEKGVVIANKKSFLVQGDKAVSLGELEGARPMVLCGSERSVYYGEYRSNPERSPVHIWGLDFLSGEWRSVWFFEGVRHVHGVFQDPFTNAIWVTTGDSDEEAAIWRTDDCFSTLQCVVGGTQQFRAVHLLFTADYVYFGSDAPDEHNYIYRMDRAGTKVERLASVGGSVFYGCTVGDSLFFSTAVEPSNVNPCRYAEVWCSNDGVNWFKYVKFKKDFLSMKFFQYGQVFFPNCCGDETNFWCSPFATNKHGSSIKITDPC